MLEICKEMTNFMQKFDEFNMTWGFVLFVIFMVSGVVLIILNIDFWILGTILIITSLLSIFRQMALLVA